MHMADALLSPTVGGGFIAASGGLLAYSAWRLGREPDKRRVPLMGVLGAFVFAVMMINFTIPGTGSSGHLVGGMLLAILLGPYAAFLVIASVLVVQSLFFLDGGILALGTNIFNMGVWPCFFGLLIYRAIAGRQSRAWRLWLAAVVSVVVSLELGAVGVVLQTLLSHRTDLPFGRFLALMAGIHLPIALVEGVITATVVQYVRALRPGAVGIGERGMQAAANGAVGGDRLVPVLISFLGLAILTGGVFAQFASSHPDGLEWSLAQTQKGGTDPNAPPVPSWERVQNRLALMPNYDFPRGANEPTPAATETQSPRGPWPEVRVGTSLAGIVGAVLTLAVVCVLAGALYWIRPHRKASL